MYRNRKVTVIIPALNEAPSIGLVLDGLLALEAEDNSSFDADGLQQPDKAGGKLIDEIVLCDNGSTDETAAIAIARGALVVEEPEAGYGAACLAALGAATDKDIVVFVDGDHSVEAKELPGLIEPLIGGADLVIGSRTLGRCEKGALSIPQHIGNRLASSMMRLLWRANVTDLGPLRAVTNEALSAIAMTDRRFGWTVEMQVRAYQLKQHVVEIPVSTRKRIGKSKIGGTVKGVIGASHGILGTIFKLYLRQLKQSMHMSRSVDTTDALETEERLSVPVLQRSRKQL